ncbi:GDP-mannose 4,6-dehydratase [Candidatus Woesearchaeota archaeon]|nr:GDP-mannose 4,6-dehydratase [Candidatus Woesearchaeota archaeon]
MILVTGAAGFIGSHVCEALAKEGKHVIGVDNFNSYYSPKIKESNIEALNKNKNFSLYREDIKNIDGLKNIFKNSKIEKIIHLAARVGVRPSISMPDAYVQDNIQGTLNLLELARENSIKNFVFGSSSSVYGGNKKIPFSENDEVNSQISPYGFTKRSCELLCNTYHNLYGMNIACLRFFTVYGPRGRPDMAIYKFAKMINEEKKIEVYGNGTSKRDYTYVSDIVKGILLALEKNKGFEIINLGDNNPVILKDVIRLIENNLDKKAKIKMAEKQQGDMEVTYANISKAKKLLGWSPEIDFKQGIKSFTEWFKSNKISLTL